MAPKYKYTALVQRDEKKKGWKTRLAAFLERNRFFIDMMLAGGFDVVNITLFANLTTAQMATKFMLGLGARVLFPIAMAIMGLELVWSWTKVGLERRFGKQSRFATLAHAVMMTFLVPLIIFLFIKASLLLPYFFVTAFASMTAELFISAGHCLKKATKNGYGWRKFLGLESEAKSDYELDELGMSPKAYFKQAVTLGAFALVNTALTAVIAFVMVILGPLAAPVAAAVGTGFAVVGAAIRAVVVRKAYKDKQAMDVKPISLDGQSLIQTEEFSYDYPVTNTLRGDSVADTGEKKGVVGSKPLDLFHQSPSVEVPVPRVAANEVVTEGVTAGDGITVTN